MYIKIFFKKPAYETENSIETKTETKANYCETVIEIKRWFRDYAGLEAYNISDSCPATLCLIQVSVSVKYCSAH